MWKVPILLSLFPSINCDDTYFHLQYFLNHSVSPCADFYSHVCSADFRCGSRNDCYLDEFYYFFNIYNITTQQVEESLAFFAKHADRSSIPKLINIAKMKEHSKYGYVRRDNDYIIIHFLIVIDPYVKLSDRLAIMNEMVRHNATNHVVLNRLRKLALNLKEAIANLFMITPWLNETDAFGLDRLSQFLTTLDEITIMTDFDGLDANLTTWRSIHRFVTSKYFEYNKRTTGCPQFDVIHPFVTLKNEIDFNLETGEDWQMFTRITEGLVYNAFNLIEFNSIVLLAPIFYPIMWENSSDTTLLGFAAVLAHEMFHSFIKHDLRNSSSVFKQEADCIIGHFNSSCEVWAEASCNSGQQTFEEDGPDVEGLRVAHDLLRSIYSKKELKELEYEEFGITREEAFFYAFGVRFCGAFEDDPSDEHSSDKVRLNAVVSMLPEFSAAFGCKIGDEEYTNESSSCYLFGAQSGMARNEISVQEIKNIGSGEEMTARVPNDVEDDHKLNIKRME